MNASPECQTAPSLDPLAVPLILGVTGPRQIDPALVDSIKREITALLKALRGQYSHTPLVLLSPLVAGSDQLAAEAALEFGADVQLAAILPWPQADAVDDRQRHGEPAHYQQLLNQSDYRIEMPRVDEISVERLRNEPAARETQYEEVGRYIARHAQILIALCDRDEDHPDSQTHKVVRWHREGTNAPYSARTGSLDATRPTAVYYVSPSGKPVSPQRIVGASLDELGVVFPPLKPPEKKKKIEPPFVDQPKPLLETIWLSSTKCLTDLFVGLKHRCPWVFGRTHHGKQGQDILLHRWQSLDDFNRDSQQVAEQTRALAESRGYVLPAADAAPLGPCVERLLDLYARADVAALDYQQRSQRVARWLFVVAAVAVAAHETYAHAWHEWYVLAAYPLLLLAGYFWFQRSRRRDYQGRWLDLRALAETLRVQIFWHVAGRPECTADYYLRHFRGELDWIRHAARAIFLTAGGHTAAEMFRAGNQVERLRLVRNNWVVDQLNYFVKKSPLNFRLEIAFETAAKLAFFVAMALSVLHVTWHIATQNMSHGLVLATFGCLVTAAFLEEFADLQTYALTARKFEWMAELFAVAEQKLSQSLPAKDAEPSSPQATETNFVAAQNVVFELGCEALAENADWVVQHRHRPPTIPGG